MPKKPTSYSGNYRKPMARGGKATNAGLGSDQPPVQYDANQIASPNKSMKKSGAKNSRPNMRR
jgi:hypothetical protein